MLNTSFEIAMDHRWHAPCLSAGKRSIQVSGNVPGQTNRRDNHGRRSLHHLRDILFHPLCALCLGTRKDLGMDIIVGCIGVVLIVYLFFSVVRPERF
jgi:hypothetical protein